MDRDVAMVSIRIAFRCVRLHCWTAFGVLALCGGRTP